MALSIRTYKKGECITFKSTKGNYGALSNMAPNYPLSINGVIILNAEALYQCMRFPDYPDIQREIIKFGSPISAKKYGRTVIQNTRKDWNQYRFSIMKLCLEIKLYQNYATFSQILLETNDLPIVEYTDKDKVWGAILEGEYYIGTNALGRLLMELREKVKTNSFKVHIPNVPNLKFLGENINFSSINLKSEI